MSNAIRCFRSISTCAIVLLFLGCASDVSILSQVSGTETNQPQRKGQYRVVAVDVASDGKADDLIDQISAAIVLKLRSQRAFDRVVSKSMTLEKQFDLVVFVTPKDYSNQDTAQAWVGIFGGRSSLEVQVVLRNGATGQALVTGTVEGKAPTKTTLFSSSSMALAIELVAEQVAKFVVGHTQ